MKENPIEQIRPQLSDSDKKKISLKPEDMTGKFHIDEERKRNSIKEEAKSRLISDLTRGYLDYLEKENIEGADNVRNYGDDSDDNDYDNSNNDNDWEWERKQRLSKMPEDVKRSIEVQQAAKEGMLQSLSQGNIEQAIEIKDTFSISSEFIYSPKILSVIQEEIIYRASYKNIDGVIEVIDKLLPERSTEISSPKLEQIYKNLLAKLISTDHVEKAIEVRNKLSMSSGIILSTEVQYALKEKLSIYLRDRDIREAEYLKEQFSLTADFMASSEIQNVTRKLITRILSNDSYYSIEQATEIKDKFSLSEASMTQAIKDSLIAKLTMGDHRTANKIIERFSVLPEVIGSPEVQRAAEVGMLDCLENDEYNSIEYAIAIKDKFFVSSEFLNTKKVQQVIRKVVAEYLSDDYLRIDEAVKIKDQFLLSELATKDAAKEGILAKIESGKLYDAQKIRETFSISDETMRLPEVYEAARKAMIKLLQGGDYDSISDALRIKSTFSLPTEITFRAEVQLAAKSGMTRCLAKGNVYEANMIKNELSLSAENTLLAAKEGMMMQLLNGNISSVDAIQNNFTLSQEILASPEVQQAATKGMLKCLSDDAIESAIKIKNKFSLPVELVAQPIKDQLIKSLLSFVSRGPKDSYTASRQIDIALRIKKEFPSLTEIFSSEEVYIAAEEGLLALMSKMNVGPRYFDLINSIISEFSLPSIDYFISSPEVQQIARMRVVEYLSNNNIDSSWFDNVVEIIKFFSVPMETICSQEIQNLATKRLTEQISEKSEHDFVMQIKDQFLLTDEAVQHAAIDGIANLFSGGQLNYADEIKDQYSLSAENMLRAAKSAFLNCMVNEKEEIAEKIKVKYKISVNSEDVFGRFPEMQNLISDLRTISPDFALQAEKTPDLLLSLLEFKDNPDKILNIAKRNPFLLEAIASNPRFGSRLLVKYPQFDQLSKNNIETQFAIKRRVLIEHPDIDPQSVEFRILMQGLLKDYGINKKVLGEIDSKGINSERWLNYDETGYFNLGSSENSLAFSEIITTPIQRIKETIDAYAYTIKEVLTQYRTELMAFEIKLGKSEIPTEELQKMITALERARSEGNAKKVAGIEKGIENLKSKSLQEKKGILWEKLLADVASFQRLEDDVFKAQEIFIGTEKELENAVIEKMPSGKHIQEIKRKMAAAKEGLRDKFVVMERRIEEFRTNLKNMINPALGNDRSDALIQEINTRLSEQFNHFDIDRSMLKNLFSEQSDKKKDELESRPMSIFVWTRNPDIDLYQGNYSPCCICIDSKYHGAESPISDYNVDLGIQIVNVWDETKDEPVTAAWCWLGKDEKGRPALVVDNIEANTLFSANFSEQLTNELFKYLKDYARAIGVDKIVLGKANNDLPTAGALSKLIDNTEKYRKIGGANRSDGYFLEAEGVYVKVIWEKGVKSKANKSGPNNREEIQRVVFGDVKAYQLTEADFRLMRDLERRVYSNESDLIQGLELVRDIKEGNGLEYSISIWGIPQGSVKQEMIGYAVAVEDETDEGDKSIYLEDIAVAPEAQRQGIGKRLIEELVQKLKAKSSRENKSVLFDMHLRPNSLSMLDAQHETFMRMGVEKIEDVLVPDYYDEREDAVYRVYEIMPATQT